MKKLHLILLLASIAMSNLAQTVGEAFYIYRNDGGFNAFFRDEVDSIAYSNYDTDSIYFDEAVMQVVYTQDSIYRIPLAAIDSVGFVTPETIYKPNVTPLDGALFDYLIGANGMTLIFNISLPPSLMPKVGDNIVGMELTDKLPYGFAGRVKQVTKRNSEISVLCDSIELFDVVERFYGVAIIGGDEGYEVRKSSHKRAPQIISDYYDLPNTPINIPIDISKYITKKSIFDINGKAELNVNIKPNTKLKATLVIDGIRSHTSIHVDSKLVTSTRVDICGEANKEFKLNFVPNNGNLKGPWGIPLYCAYGPKLELSGEMLLELTIDATLNVVSDITYTPQMLFPSLLTPFIISNSITGRANISGFNIGFDKFGARATIKIGPYYQFGIGNNITWVGLDADDGAKIETESLFDFDRLKEANKSTLLYDELKSYLLHTEVKPYFGIHFMINHNYGDFTFKVGPEYDKFGETWLKGSLIPTFEDTKLTRSTSDNVGVDATTKIYGACPIPYSVGFSLFDSKGNRVQDPIYYDKKYHFFNQFPSYSGTFGNLTTNEKYTVYPTIKMFGYDLLASPSAELEMQFPVTLSDFKVTNSQYQKGAFTNDGKTYDYRFDVSVTATLDNSEGVADWGYVYRDPNGQEAFISLNQFGHSKIDDRWAYFRNGTPPFTCTLYGYVKYVGSNEPLRGEPHDYPLEYSLTSCPDDNHPHMIDLGLPSGTKWACCNVGASKPEDYGNYYAWGETQPKGVYSWDTYQYGSNWDNVVNIGSDIASTQYDAATANWSAPWRMPSKTQIMELLNNCPFVWTTQNGVNGIEFTGSNGGSIFLPATGYRTELGLANVTWECLFWSSTLYYESNPFLAYSLGLAQFGEDPWFQRYYGLPVRPVR